MAQGISYVQSALDRVPGLRRDEAWVAAHLHDRRTRIVPVWRDLSLVASDDAPGAVLLGDERGRAAVALAGAVALLGLGSDGAYFAVDLSDHEEPALAPFLNGARFADLREVGPLLGAPEAGLLAFARGMMHWHRASRFCGRCGSPTEAREGGYLRLCVNAACGCEHHPRTDPAVIMLVTRSGADGEACLLGRQARWPQRRYSTLAGFVEPGETLEAAVAREVLEETGIRVGEVRYRGSQPWPFPSSLMIGFRAVAESVEIRLNDRELQDARWFSRDDIARFPELGFDLPRLGSIARGLIAAWLDEGTR